MVSLRLRSGNRDPRASPWYSVPSSNFAKCVYALQNYWVYIIPSASLRAAIQPWASPVREKRGIEYMAKRCQS